MFNICNYSRSLDNDQQVICCNLCNKRDSNIHPNTQCLQEQLNLVREMFFKKLSEVKIEVSNYVNLVDREVKKILNEKDIKHQQSIQEIKESHCTSNAELSSLKDNVLKLLDIVEKSSVSRIKSRSESTCKLQCSKLKEDSDWKGTFNARRLNIGLGMHNGESSRLNKFDLRLDLNNIHNLEPIISNDINTTGYESQSQSHIDNISVIKEKLYTEYSFIYSERSNGIDFDENDFTVNNHTPYQDQSDIIMYNVINNIEGYQSEKQYSNEECSFESFRKINYEKLLLELSHDELQSEYEEKTKFEHVKTLDLNVNIQSIDYTLIDRRIAIASSDGKIYIISKHDGEIRLVIDTKCDSASYVSWSPNGFKIGALCFDNIIKIYNSFNGKLKVEIPLFKFSIISSLSETHKIYNFSWSSDCYKIACGSYNNYVKIYDSESGSNLHNLEGHSEDVLCVQYSKSGNLLASGGADGLMFIWDMEEMSLMKMFNVTSGQVIHVAWNNLDDSIVSIASDNSLKIFHIDESICIRQIEGNGSINTIRVSAAGIYCYSDGSQVWLLDKESQNYFENENEVKDVVWFDQELFAIGDVEGKVKIFNRIDV